MPVPLLWCVYGVIQIALMKIDSLVLDSRPSNRVTFKDGGRTPRERHANMEGGASLLLLPPDGGGRLISEEDEKRRKVYKSLVGRATIATVFFSNFVVYTSLSMLAPFFPMYAHNNLHASSLTIGFIFSAHP